MSTVEADGVLANTPVRDLHDLLADVGRGPAGGSAAGVAAAMAAGLVRLVARVSRDWDDAPGIAAQAALLGERALELAEADHVAYTRAVAQLRAPDRDAALGAALRRAAEVPLGIAETAADVAALASLAARHGADAVRPDAWTAATLAEAAATAAGRLVAVNLATIGGDDLTSGADAAARAAGAARAEALGAG